VNLIILAGGRNSRIQTRKALLSVGGRPLVERIVERLRPVADGCLIVTGDPEAFAFLGVPTTADRYPGKGPLGGLEAGLHASTAELNLAVACDLPFVSPDLALHLRWEAEAHPEADAVIPRWAKGREPLFAIYRKRVAGALAGRLEAGDLRLGHLDSAVALREVEVGPWAGEHGIDLEQAFCNINTWAEWEKAEVVARNEAAAPAGPPLVLVVGWQDAGKTTVTAALVREFSRAGLRVAVIKHDPHGHETDTPGKDTYLHRQAGAVATMLASPRLVTTWQREEKPLPLPLLARRLPPVDLILAEGWKEEAFPRVVVIRPEASPGPVEALWGPGEVLAVVGGPAEAAGLVGGSGGPPPVFAPDEAPALAAFLLDRLGVGRRG
jgi:molybdopterin-guanine dinucleotide biosynthesis protein MobB